MLTSFFMYFTRSFILSICIQIYTGRKIVSRSTTGAQNIVGRSNTCVVPSLSHMVVQLLPEYI